MKTIITFLSSLCLITAVYSQRLPSGTIVEEYDANSWKLFFSSEYDYDQNLFKTAETSKSWNAADNKWEPFDRTEYKYDSLGNVVESARLTWNKGTKKWDYTQRTYEEYDNSSKLIASEIQYYDNTYGWFKLSLDSSFYNANGDIELLKKYWWNGSFYEYSGRRNYSYNGSNQLISEVYAWISGSSAQWDTINRTNYGYMLPHTDTATQEAYLGNGKWRKELKYITVDSNDVIRSRESFRYDTLTSTFLKTDLLDYSFHSDDSPDEALFYSWNTDSLKYLNRTRIKYQYNVNIGIDSHNSETKKMSIYPNPASNDIKIALPVEISSGQLEVYDINGRMVTQEQINSRITGLNTSAFSDGYFLVIVKSNGVTYREVLIVE